MKRLGVVAALALTVLLGGCAAVGPGAQGASPSPTRACPWTDAPSDPGCAYYDPDAAMAQNDAYRQELPAPEDALAALDAALGPVRAAVEPLGPDASGDEVRAALAAVGFADVSISSVDPDAGFPFAVFNGACLRGWWTSTPELVLETGGLIADGGCLTAPGH